LKRSTEIDESDEYKHFCRCTEDIRQITSTEAFCSAGKSVNSQNNFHVHQSVATNKIFTPAPCPTISASIQPFINNQTKISDCPSSLQWIVGKDCSDLRDLSILVWALLFVNLLQIMVIIIVFYRKITQNKNMVDPEQTILNADKIGSADKDERPERNELTENIYCEPQRVIHNSHNYGYMTMTALTRNNAYEVPVPINKTEFINYAKSPIYKN